MIVYSTDYPQSFYDGLIEKARVEQIQNFSEDEFERVFGLCATKTACKNGFWTLIELGLTMDDIYPIKAELREIITTHDMEKTKMEPNQIVEKQFIPLFMIDANPWQTSQIDQAHTEELAHDIKEHGMMQTPTARPFEGRYQLAFGHHRLAAYRLLSSLGNDYYDNFPLYIQDLNDEQMAIAAFSENEKRRTLNPVDRARAVKKMLEDFGWTQELVAEKLRIDRSGVSNMVRMLRLPPEVLETVAAGDLPVRSAMALIPIFEITTSEQVKLEDRFGESLADFLTGAKKGEVNSDVIRARVEFYMTFLHPEPAKLFDESILDTPVVIENDSVTANDEPEITATPGQFMPPPPPMPNTTQGHIDDWMNKSNEGENGQEQTFQDAAAIFAEEAREGPEHTASVDSEPEIQAAQPVPATNPPMEKTEVAPSIADQPDPNEILFTITWRTNGVVVGYKKPGWAVPKLRFMSHLRPDGVPAVMKEMGIGSDAG